MDCRCPKRRCDTEAAFGLPDDPLVEILSRVPVKSLCRFKCVSQAWRDLIADPVHRKKLPQTLEGFFFLDEEHRDSDSRGDECDSSNRDGDSDDEEPPHQFYGFIDVLQGSVRPVDFSFLTEMLGRGIQQTRLVDFCNGLFLFVVDHSSYESYIVCNPATKQCVAVPSSGFTYNQSSSTITYLLFDPGVRGHFSLIQFNAHVYITSVLHVYSSETQAWSRSKSDRDCCPIEPCCPYVYVNGMLHLLSCWGKDRLIVVDVEGNIQKIIPAPCQVGWKPLSGYIGQSQGCLYYICHDDEEVICDGFARAKWTGERCSIWVLQDYDRQQWVLKDSVSISKLFGGRNCYMDSDYNVIGIHPDHSSLVFIEQKWNHKLISYNMDSKEVRVLCTLGHGYECITPYVPYFLEFGA